jgi:hypothetical protein
MLFTVRMPYQCALAPPARFDRQARGALLSFFPASSALDRIRRSFDVDCNLPHLLRSVGRSFALMVERDLAEAPCHLSHALRIVDDFGHIRRYTMMKVVYT